MAGENNNGNLERGHITIDFKNINVETLIDIVNRIDVEKLSAALSILGVKQDNKTNIDSTSSNLTNTEDTEKKLKLDAENSSNNESESEEPQFEPIEGTEDTNLNEVKNNEEKNVNGEKNDASTVESSNKAAVLNNNRDDVLKLDSNNTAGQSRPTQTSIVSPKQSKIADNNVQPNNYKQSVPQNPVSTSPDSKRDHAVYKADNSSKSPSVNKNAVGAQNDYRSVNDKEKTAITSNPNTKQSTQKSGNTAGTTANQIIQTLNSMQGKNNKSKSGSGNINIPENLPTRPAASRPVVNTSANTMNKKLEILNAIKPMLDYERYQILDNIIKIYSIGKLL